MLKNLIFFITILSFSSCMSLALKITGITETKAEIIPFKYKDKSCVFVPMHHIGKKEFYDDVRKKTDSLKSAGYIIFYEGLFVDNKDDKTALENDMLKFRKLFGRPIKPYLDSTKKQFQGIDVKKLNLVSQPSNKNLGVDSLKDMHAEMPLNKLIKEIEKKYGPIILEDCDQNTLLKAPSYDCKAEKNGLQKMQDIRNDFLANEIATSKEKKIAVFFGKTHYNEILKILKTIEGK